MAYELDQLAAVVATLGPEPFDLVGTSMGALAAVAWAAACPDTVRRLVLYGGWVSGADISPPSALLAMSYSLDITDLLAQVHAPTLVVHRAHDRAAPVEQAATLADGIAGAQLVVLSGRSHLPYVGDTQTLVATIRLRLGFRSRAQIAAWYSTHREAN
ncbi:alpha/beta fold hydrolase [Rathayibacter soli]|uniref:alpha/beta fold hydrolase n=1 Tax=Rathayibacter soli TaxID=3144168 RepID=UPI0027E54DD4|nr:alpha/beta fold hydrolase [Glaciibacter superstes]